MTPPDEHTSEGGRDDRGVPYHAESTLSGAQGLKLSLPTERRPNLARYFQPAVGTADAASPLLCTAAAALALAPNANQDLCLRKLALQHRVGGDALVEAGLPGAWRQDATRERAQARSPLASPARDEKRGGMILL